MNMQTIRRQAQKSKAAVQRGVSNIQVAIVILVGVLLLLGGLSGYRYIQQAKVNNEIQTINDLKAATMRFGQFQPLTAIATADAAATAGFFDNTSIRVVEGIVTNQWGGTVEVKHDNGLIFTFNNVPKSVCVDISTKLDNVADEVGGTLEADIKSHNNSASLANAHLNCKADGQLMVKLTV